MTKEERTLILDQETGSVEYFGMPVFIIPRELLVGTAQDMLGSTRSLTGRGMLSIYRVVSRKVGERIFRVHLPVEVGDQTGEELIGLVFDRFMESGWGRYSLEKAGQDKYIVRVRHFWLGEALKGVDDRPLCALVEGILISLFARAFGRKVKVEETHCVAIGSEVDEFEVCLR